ncbi:MAG: DNA primase [Clostridia bacterium]|nr:DNA primase [Clostridia bacterium]
MAYPKSFIDELKMRNNIVDTIGRYVDLKRAGSNMSGLCPFHSERTPSFTVFQDNFHCFGCGAGGDVITFTMKIENLDYRGAIELLAQRAGIPVPQDSGFVPQKKEILSRERGLLMNKLAARHFYENLMHAPEAQAARDYIVSRKIDGATMRRFGLGFAKNSFDDLMKYLLSQGFTKEEMKEGFLCGISQKGNYYDIFRNRIMIPIIDLTGNIVAFGGRVMDDSKPKYLNSSDTPVFKKSKNLFAMNFAKNAVLGDKGREDGVSGSVPDMTGKLIMCEGYMDVIALHQAGFTNAVATLGTAITQEHARFVSRYAKTVYLAYDSDNAGKNATRKAINLLSEVGVDAKVINIVGAKDPDEYIKKYGNAAFSRLLDGSVGQIDYRLGEILKKYNMEISEEKERAVLECCTMLSEVFPEYRREIYIGRLCDITKVSKQSVEIAIRRLERKKGAVQNQKFTREAIDEMRRFNDKINPDAMKYPKACELEERILGILMLYPEHIGIAKEKVSNEDFLTEFNKLVYAKLLDLYESDRFDLSYLNEYFNPDQMGRIHGIAKKRRLVTANGEQTLLEAINQLVLEKQRVALNKPDADWMEKINANKKKHGVSDKKDG